MSKDRLLMNFLILRNYYLHKTEFKQMSLFKEKF